MPEPNATIVNTSQGGVKAEQSLTNAKNRVGNIIITGDPFGKRVPEYYLGIFSVNTQAIRVSRPWVVNGVVTFPGRKEGELYSKPFVIPDIQYTQMLRAGTDEVVKTPQRGEFLAQDICNPAQPEGDWRTYRELDPDQQEASGNINNNYYDRGLFWERIATPQSEPSTEALNAAIDRLEAFYNKMLREANQLYTAGPKGQAQIAQPHHDAADYFIQAGNDLNLPWHAVLSGGLKSRLTEARKPAPVVAPVAAPVAKAPVTKLPDLDASDL